MSLGKLMKESAAEAKVGAGRGILNRTVVEHIFKVRSALIYKTHIFLEFNTNPYG
jgi:hypothetical protein